VKKPKRRCDCRWDNYCRVCFSRLWSYFGQIGYNIIADTARYIDTKRVALSYCANTYIRILPSCSWHFLFCPENITYFQTNALPPSCIRELESIPTFGT